MLVNVQTWIGDGHLLENTLCYRAVWHLDPLKETICRNKIGLYELYGAQAATARRSKKRATYVVIISRANCTTLQYRFEMVMAFS